MTTRIFEPSFSTRSQPRYPVPFNASAPDAGLKSIGYVNACGFAFGFAGSFALKATPTRYEPASSVNFVPSAPTAWIGCLELIVALCVESISSTRTRFTGAWPRVVPV